MTTIKLRRGTAAQWTTSDPILAQGELGFETDTNKHKIGDGTSHWSALKYFVDEIHVADVVAAEGTARDLAITNAVNGLVNGAPGALDTLKELSDTLGSDENAASALTTLVGGIRDLTDTAHKTALSNAYASRWMPNTVYNSGDTVVAPDGSLVKAKTSFTSGSSYNSTNWSSVNVTSGTQAATELLAAFVTNAKIPQAGPGVPAAFRYPVTPGGYVVWREDRNGAESYWLGRPTSSLEFDCYELTNQVCAVGGSVPALACMALGYHDARQAVTGVILSDASVVFTGANWTQTTDTRAYSGVYKRDSTAGQSVTFSPPNSSDKAYVRILNFTNGGYALVTALVDGVPVDMPLLSSAQAEVTAGRMLSSALVANGGSLNPTDRVIRFYGTPNNYDILTPVIEGMATGVSKSITLAVVNTIPVGSTDVRTYLGGFAYHDSGTAFSGASVRQVTTGVLLSDGSVSTSGAGWTQVTDTRSYSGVYKRTNVSGQSITWAPVSTSDAVYLHALNFSNGGYGVATLTVGGVATTCNRLPTAQAEVTAGRMPSTALVANGGPLNPTDRVVLFYGYPNNHDIVMPVADGLATTGAKSLTITATSVLPTGSSDTRLYLGGFAYHDASSAISGSSERGIIQRHQNTLSAWEMAIHAVPTGRTGAGQWQGAFTHGYQRGDSYKVVVDGQEAIIADGVSVSGSNIMIVTTSTILDTFDGTTEIGKVTATYVITDVGIRCSSVVRWLTGGILASSSYWGMAPHIPSFSRAKNVALVLAENATASDGSFKANAASDLILMWQPATSGKYGSYMQITDPASALRGYPATIKLAVEDRAGGSLKKAYALRADASVPETFSAGDVWRFCTTWGTTAFNNPENVLAVL